jgi:hypothetical protein
MGDTSKPSKGRLHGVSLSPFVRKVRAVLAIKGIDYELVNVMPGARSVLGGESRARRRRRVAGTRRVPRSPAHAPQLAAIVEEARAMLANA